MKCFKVICKEQEVVRIRLEPCKALELTRITDKMFAEKHVSPKVCRIRKNSLKRLPSVRQKEENMLKRTFKSIAI